ncbi:Rne/Rng family ribonuclease [Cupriavidus basilensis]
MTEDILVNITPQETRVAIVQQAAVQELHVERTLTRGLVGNIYLGKVVRVLPGMQSAFIDIGLERAAFLHVADIWHPRDPDKNGTQLAIEKTLFEGQALMVQVIKDPIGTKGARLSTQVSIAGRTLVYLPQDPHIGISQRIEGKSTAKRCAAACRAWCRPMSAAALSCARLPKRPATKSSAMTSPTCARSGRRSAKNATTQPAPSLLYQDLDLAQRVLRDFINDATGVIQIDSRENYQRLVEFAQEYTPAVLARLSHYTGERPIFDLFNIDAEIEKALSRRVDLKSGGYLMIDQTEAMTTIDVNTGGYVGARNFDDTIFKTNLEAAHTIARQLRLRNLGGIIIIDFIDMENVEHREAVLLGTQARTVTRSHAHHGQ